jgi:2-oxo-4-hydroxy-4-carboxy-5-ureidoimidazoline decarboxylase
MNEILKRWNQLPFADAVGEVIPCCGSKSWAQLLAGRRPITSESSLLAASDHIWHGLDPSDWLEAFDAHPRIGESSNKAPVGPQSQSWSRQEQGQVTTVNETVKTELAEANRAYEQRFGHIFIVCATGKSASEILAILRRRMQNDGNTELREAADEQRQITQLRLKKWLGV